MKTKVTQKSNPLVARPLLVHAVSSLIRRYGRADLTANDIQDIIHLMDAIHDRSYPEILRSLLKDNNFLMPEYIKAKLQSELPVSTKQRIESFQKRHFPMNGGN